MKAAILRAFGGPEALVIDAVEKPHPGPGEVLIRIEAAGINFTDTAQRAGSLGPMPLPLVMGGEVAGIVEAVGGEVGDVVACATAAGGAPARTA